MFVVASFLYHRSLKKNVLFQLAENSHRFFHTNGKRSRYFFGCKISGSCIFLGSQYEAPSDPPVMYTASTPLGTCFPEPFSENPPNSFSFIGQKIFENCHFLFNQGRDAKLFTERMGKSKRKEGRRGGEIG